MGFTDALGGDALHRLVDEIPIPGLGDVGAKRAGHDAVHAHVRAEGLGEADGDGVQSGFGRGVGKDVRGRMDGGDRGDVDDRTRSSGGPTSLHHARTDQRTEAEGAFQVESEHGVPELFIDVEDRLVQRRLAGIVDQDVEAAQFVPGEVGETFQFRPAAHVTGIRQAPTSGSGFDLAGCFLAGLERSAGDDHIGALAGEGQRHLAAETPAAAGHEGGATGEIEEVSRIGQGLFVGRRHGSTLGGGLVGPEGRGLPQPGDRGRD